MDFLSFQVFLFKLPKEWYCGIEIKEEDFHGR